MKVYLDDVFWFEIDKNYDEILQLPQVVAKNQEIISRIHIMQTWCDGPNMYFNEV